MRKIIVLLLFLLIIPIYSGAEISTNLNIKTVQNRQTPSLIERRTYVDAEGNTVVPDDKGYATIRYIYSRRILTREECLDENDKLVNCSDGYAYKVYL